MIAAGASVAGSLVFGSSPIAESLIVRLSFTFPPNPAPYCAKAKREDGVRFCPTAREGGRVGIAQTYRFEEVKVLDDWCSSKNVLHVDSRGGQDCVLGRDAVLLLAQQEPELGGVLRQVAREGRRGGRRSMAKTWQRVSHSRAQGMSRQAQRSAPVPRDRGEPRPREGTEEEDLQGHGRVEC